MTTDRRFKQREDTRTWARDEVVRIIDRVYQDTDPSTHNSRYVGVAQNAHPGLITVYHYDDATHEHTRKATYRVVLEEVTWE